jgi:hypothetical protein
LAALGALDPRARSARSIRALHRRLDRRARSARSIAALHRVHLILRVRWQPAGRCCDTRFLQIQHGGAK